MAASAGVTYPQLERICAKKGLRVTMAQFDNGQTVTVFSTFGRIVCRITAEWTDPMGAPDLTASWLVQHGWITTGDMVVPDASTDA